MDTAWLDGKISADHYRHSRPSYLRALERAGLMESLPAEESFVTEEPRADAPSDQQKS
jgi:hypothetical protein